MVDTNAEFDDPRLVALYETLNQYEPGSQPDFYAWLACDIGAGTIVDVGCGTGMITRALAAQGFTMIGVEPAPAMLQIARARPHGELVRWIDGDVSCIGRPGADMAMMSGHVAQFFVDDGDWDAALGFLHAALRPGGHLAFESRNPLACGWEQWEQHSAAVDPVAGRVETWSSIHEVRDGVVSYANHYLFEATGEEVVAPATMRFRTIDELHESLAAAGFAVDTVFGDWDRRPPGDHARELIVVAST